MLKEGEVVEGDVVKLDDGFTCQKQGPIEIQKDKKGLFFPCSAGKHYIDGQLDEDGTYIGIGEVEKHG